MKNIFFISFFIFVVSACTEKQPEVKQTTETSSGKDEPLNTIAAKAIVGNMNLPKAAPKDSNRKAEREKITPRNRIQVIIDQKRVIDHAEFEAEVTSFSEGKIVFSNNAEVEYWIPDNQKFTLVKKDRVKVVFNEELIYGAIFSSLKLYQKEKLPLLHIISTGSNTSIQAILVDGFTIQQTNREQKISDNSSETVAEVSTILNGKTPLQKNKPVEFTTNSISYSISVNTSTHYTPKGTDSFEGPLYYLEYTLVKK